MVCLLLRKEDGLSIIEEEVWFVCYYGRSMVCLLLRKEDGLSVIKEEVWFVCC